MYDLIFIELLANYVDELKPATSEITNSTLLQIYLSSDQILDYFRGFSFYNY